MGGSLQLLPIEGDSIDAPSTGPSCHDRKSWLEAYNELGGVALEEAAKDHPYEAFKVWTGMYPRDYTEDSRVCNAFLLLA